MKKLGDIEEVLEPRLADLDLALVNKVEDVIEVLTLDPGEEDTVKAGGQGRAEVENLSEPLTKEN